MSKFHIVMPKMGESVLEATITKWHKKPGDTISEDEAIAEIATDKVDSEIPSPVDGILTELKFNEGDVVAVGTVIAVVETEADSSQAVDLKPQQTDKKTVVPGIEKTVKVGKTDIPENEDLYKKKAEHGRFYSPLVKTIARSENISFEELEKIKGSGKDGRVTKDDIMAYLGMRQNVTKAPVQGKSQGKEPVIVRAENDTIIEMDRMRKLIADHMVNSVKTSAHVTSFIEVKMGKVVQWREKVKKQFELQWGEKLTYTHIILEAAARTLLEFPGINASVDGYNVILRKNINIGMATALADGNLIVPVIKNADQRNLLGLAKEANRLAEAARTGKLQPDDITEGTFTFTNLGSFGSLTGTPIINQPQVAILGAGVISKKPVVIETPVGDAIGIEPIMILSLSYDHRIVDGALGGMFLKRVSELLETFNTSRTM